MCSIGKTQPEFIGHVMRMIKLEHLKIMGKTEGERCQQTIEIPLVH